MRKKVNISKFPLFLCMTLTCFQTIQGKESNRINSFIVENDEEAFLIRRIAEFWKDQDYEIVKQQIQHFIITHPESKITDQLNGVWADLLLQEGKHEEALEKYSLITKPEVLEKTIINKLQCYYELNQYENIEKEGKPYLSSDKADIVERKTELNFLIAESLFRRSHSIEDAKQKKSVCLEAKKLYEELLDSPFKEHSEFALAEIYNTLEEYPLAADQYLQLAKNAETKKEELLFLAASAQSQFDNEKAIETFSKVIAFNGARKQEAFFNRLILFFQTNQFDNVIEEYEKNHIIASDENKAVIEYMMGRSHFARNEYKKAEAFLTSYLDSNNDNLTYQKNSLLMLLTCGQKLQNTAVFESALDTLKNNYPQTEELMQAKFVHAMMLKEQGKLNEAVKELQTLIANKDFTERENLLLEYASICHDKKQWDEAYKVLTQYLENYPNSKQTDVAWKYFLSSIINLYGEGKETSKEQFLSDLNKVLTASVKFDNLLTEEEKHDCQLIFAKTAYELDKPKIALEMLLSGDLSAYNKNSSEINYLIALCHQKLNEEPEKFYTYLEKAISLDPNLADYSSVHLQLYNAYLKKAEQVSSEQKAPFAYYEKAAEHLYTALEKGDVEIKLQNKLWLANQYYEKVKIKNLPEDSEEYHRAVKLYHLSLVKQGTQNIITINQENLFLEPEILKYTALLNNDSKSNFKINLLKDLVGQQYQNKNFGWKLRKQTLLELAKAYEENKLYDNALEIYKFISTEFSSEVSYATDYAKLHSTRIESKQLNPQSFSDESHLNQVLCMLKDFQIRKNIDSEPMHLEAGIDYARLRANLSKNMNQEDRYIFFLSRLKEDYESIQDPVAASYQQQLAKKPEKQPLYQLYMQFIEAEMLRAKAKMQHKNNQIAEAEELNLQALSKFSEIKENPAATGYLKDQISSSIAEIDNLNAY